MLVKRVNVTIGGAESVKSKESREGSDSVMTVCSC